MDKTAAIKLLGGTIARGILWGLSFLAGAYGLENIGQDTATGLGAFIASVIVAAVATFWSKKNEKKLSN